MKKIFFFDIDGTLIDCRNGNNNVSELTKYAIEQLRNNNHLVFIASGRSYSMLPEVIKQLDTDGFLLTNGAYAQMNNKVLFSNFLSKKAVKAIIDVCTQTKSLFFLETQHNSYVSDVDDPEIHKFYSDWGIPDIFKPLDLNVNYNMAMIVCDSEKTCEIVKSNISMYTTPTRHNSYTSFDVACKDITKGSGIKQLCSILNVDIESSYCFGDGHNDVDMMNTCKHSIAMANGCDEVKQAAKFITKSVSEDGIYHWLVENKIIDAKI